ncbi:MAG: hypothetical protein CFH41_01233 [Alphaproteobacteria bacterium MarineAlpha11_Bin1]|nr:MAG: hypothetical protein CFH41_01233 [Alphaproteobacteria bacterium MarineAlpha11_Bin1]
MRAVRKLAHAILHVSPELKIAPADIYSRLDGAVQQFGLDATERFFAESQAAQALAREMCRFLDDPEAERSLKKGYHVRQEHRARIIALRTDPPFGPVSVPTGWHPIDRRTADGIIDSGLHPGPITTRATVVSRILLMLSPVVWGVIFIWKALSVLTLASGRPNPINSPLASHNFLRPYIFGVFADYLKSAGVLKDAAPPFIIVTDQPDEKVVDSAIATTLNVNTLRVPAVPWLSNVVWPGTLLFARIVWITVRHGKDARVPMLAAVAMRQAFHSIYIWRIGYNTRFRFFLDIAEYNEHHNLKAIIFRKFGGKVARWPTSSIDSPGSITSYLGYDIFLSPGPYQSDTYGRTWSPTCSSLAVGFLHKDPCFGSGTDVADEYEELISHHLGAGKKMIVLFGSSDASTECFGPPMADMLMAVREVLAGRDDYLVVIKPKGRKGEYLHKILQNSHRLAEWLAGPDVLSVHYDETDTEVCGAGWLIDRMAIGIGNAGTVMTEAMAHRKPYIAYYPVFAPTPLSEKMVREGFMHDNIQSFTYALAHMIDAPEAINVPVEWLREQFDPFDDDKALERVVDALFVNPSLDCIPQEKISLTTANSNPQRLRSNAKGAINR